jgi:GNAT superfamily N-acetyltransferase
MPDLVFDRDYAEDVALEDGTVAHLRLIRPEDKRLMLEAWERLSPESRYRRFFSAKSALSRVELRYLTELDNVDHLAIGASCHRDGVEVAIGVARFIRLATRPDAADAAVTVVDDAQRRGLGRVLLTRLIAAARERGVECFVCDVLADNDAMRRLLHSLSPGATERPDGMTVTIQLPLGEAEVEPDAVGDRSAIYRLFALVGRGLSAVRSSFLDPPERPDDPA